jgi:hypothetical protein
VNGFAWTALGTLVLLLVGFVALLWLVRRGRREDRTDTTLEIRDEPAVAQSTGDDRPEILLGGRPASPRSPSDLPRVGDRLEASALVPPVIRADVPFRLEAVIASQGSIVEAIESVRAGRIGLQAARPMALASLVQRDSIIEVGVECAEAVSINPRMRRIPWDGGPAAASFQIRPPAAPSGESLLIDLNFFIGRVCIGYVPLSLPFATQQQASIAGHAPVASGALRTPQRVFMSYTGADRAQVLPIALALRRLEIKTFMDRLSLEGGDLWEERLNEEIDACDCFMLFWSHQSARSTWVQRETLRALARRRASSDMTPKIVTHLLGPPPPAPIPSGLEALHFNDPAYAVWEMAVAEAAGPA